MTAPRHERAAFWQQAAAVRDEWHGYGTACGPTGQAVAEQALTEVYRRLGRPRPEFVWVRSPHEAQPLVRHLPTLQDLYTWVTDPPLGERPPLASDLAASLARLRGTMDDRIAPPLFDPKPPKRDKGQPWPNQTAEAALAYGVPFVDIVRRHVREALYTSLAGGFYLPGKRLLGAPGPVCWYGQQEAHWIAYYEVWRRLGLANYGSAVDAELDGWQALARSAGWFWPDEGRCVVSARPVAGTTFADGWSITPATTG
ncbi:hypothetical protein [Catellatospora citrea]|uniref:Uncharacterized protein n=1 Tax=Catellatospora citrea TaxID=53366 RepID=A0A8J3KM34_9ACTN|nr:hypothetical protein [Catellatospora citrea]RKE06068.1 hypothetical protein C8E86_0886 [Catellatospora citrea]GIF97734.1 hypothetical protein Cci01nite_28280 [Catellatospora citrea]